MMIVSLFAILSKPALVPTQPPIYWVSGVLSLGVKRTTDLHVVSRSKNEWSYTSTPQYAFIAWCLVKAQGQIYLYLPYNRPKITSLYILSNTALNVYA
jgi:hypothetical protein